MRIFIVLKVLTKIVMVFSTLLRKSNQLRMPSSQPRKMCFTTHDEYFGNVFITLYYFFFLEFDINIIPGEEPKNIMSL